MRLCEWRLAPDNATFSYGGDEVELSVWDLETAFAPKQQPPQPQPESPGSKKRKRASELLPGELWRAKNVCVCGRIVSADRNRCLTTARLHVGRERLVKPTTTRAQYVSHLHIHDIPAAPCRHPARRCSPL
jgi:hypothetical protein